MDIKSICISTNILAATFPYFKTEPVPYTFFSRVNRRNNKARATLLHYSVDLRILVNVGAEPVPLKHEKLATEYPWIYEYIFCSAQRLTWTTVPSACSVRQCRSSTVGLYASVNLPWRNLDTIELLPTRPAPSTTRRYRCSSSDMLEADARRWQ